MRFCLINNLYKPYTRGGAEKVVEMTANGLRAQGQEVFVITVRPYSRHEKRELHPNDANIRIYQVYSPNLIFYGKLGRLPAPLRVLWHFFDMFNVAAAWKVRKIIKREKPDVVFLHNLKGLSYLIPKFVRKENLVLVPHDVQLVEPSGLIFTPSFPPPQRGGGLRWGWGLYEIIDKWLFSDIKKIISPSKWLLDFYESRGFFKNARKVVLHNPAPLPKAAEILNPKSEILNLLFVGQFEESKGIIFLINTLKDFRFHPPPEPSAWYGAGISDSPRSVPPRRDYYRGFRLTILGEGRKRQEIEKLIAGDERFKYLGKLDSEELQKVYSEADFTIVPSLVYENCPTVILESFAAGTPVIASRAGGIPEFVRDGENGFLFNAGDALDLLRVLTSASQMDLLNLQNNAKITSTVLSIENYLKALQKEVSNGKG